mmetsp:Transcript_153391/g.471915  ORF Transcript_153391/g.471915 Transcript_153391/m.471915 type:complete len:334 (+) Transcript_153391:78-1079(+)
MGAALRGVAVLFCFLGLVAAGVLAAWGVQQLTGSPRDDLLLEAAVLSALGALLVIIDWRRLGPTVACHSSSIAAAVAWLLVVPLGLGGLELVEEIPLAGFAVLAAAVAAALVLALGPPGLLLGPAAGGLIFYLSTKADSLVADLVGNAVVFAAVHFAVRRALTVRRVDQWPDAEELDPSSHEFRDRCAFFEAACLAWAHKYDFRLSVRRVFRLRNAMHRPLWANARHLFHGTPLEAAYGIVSDGFRRRACAGLPSEELAVHARRGRAARVLQRRGPDPHVLGGPGGAAPRVWREPRPARLQPEWLVGVADDAARRLRLGRGAPPRRGRLLARA